MKKIDIDILKDIAKKLFESINFKPTVYDLRIKIDSGRFILTIHELRPGHGFHAHIKLVDSHYEERGRTLNFIQPLITNEHIGVLESKVYLRTLTEEEFLDVVKIHLQYLKEYYVEKCKNFEKHLQKCLRTITEGDETQLQKSKRLLDRFLIENTDYVDEWFKKYKQE